jgi:hypothetical protein
MQNEGRTLSVIGLELLVHALELLLALLRELLLLLLAPLQPFQRIVNFDVRFA